MCKLRKLNKSTLKGKVNTIISLKYRIVEKSVEKAIKLIEVV